MASDGLFFKRLAWLHPGTRVPILAILLQAVCSMVIALTGRYNEILNYVMSVDTIFTLLILASIFIFRRREASTARTAPFRVPGHPFTTMLLIVVYGGVLVSLFYKFPANGLIGAAIALTGVPAYFFWSRRKAHKSAIPAIPQADISLAN
jgi:APA family basic amino acid/polyamine antiporter